MHVKTKNIAFLGLMMAITVLLVVLSGVFEINTFFLLALASFCTGIAIHEYGLASGTAFYIGSILLNLILAPNKLYVGTYAGIGLYIVVTEFIWRKIFKMEYNYRNVVILTIVKVIIFNAMYIPILLFFPDLLSGIKMNTAIFVVLLLIGQVILLLFDKAYKYFMNRYWGQIRRALRL